MPSGTEKGQRFQPFAAIAAACIAFAVTGCDLDLEFRAHADVRLGEYHTLHISYASGAPSSGREPSRP